jgi:hypothetical protein
MSRLSFSRRTLCCAALCILLAGCGTLNLPQRPIPVQADAAERTAAGAPTCPSPQTPGGAAAATAYASISKPLAIGTPSIAALYVSETDAFGDPIQGAFLHPVTLKLVDSDPAHPRASLVCKTVYASDKPAYLRYGGKGDHFSVEMSANGVAMGSSAFVTNLPKEALLGRPAPASRCCPNIPQGAPVVGPDGDIWTMLRVPTGDAFSAKLARIAPSGSVSTLQFHNRALWPVSGGPFIAGHDAFWLTLQDNGIASTQIERVDSSGTFARIPDPGISPSPAITSLAFDKHGVIWAAAQSLARTSDAGAIYRVSAGNLRLVSTTKEVTYNLVADPQGRGMWFSTCTGIGMVTPSGKTSIYPIPQGNRNWGPIRFFLGPDGKFWAVWVAGSRALIKVDTSGTIVSRSTLANIARVKLGSIARDRFGNTYFGDGTGCGLIRMDPHGATSEYPTYGCTAVTEDGGTVTGVVSGPNGRIYVTDEPSSLKTNLAAGGLLSFDPADW